MYLYRVHVWSDRFSDDPDEDIIDGGGPGHLSDGFRFNILDFANEDQDRVFLEYISQENYGNMVHMYGIVGMTIHVGLISTLLVE